jgi:hypothetical protein
MIRTLPLSEIQSRRVGVLAEAAAAGVILVAALPTRLANLDDFVGKFDEGIRSEQLLLMAAGFRPFRDIFASQGPLSLDAFFPTFVLFGQTLGAARIAPALLSIVGIAAAACAARIVAGPAAAVAAAFVLLVSPTFLKNSRLALVEVPALAPAVAAVAAALAYDRSGDRRWLMLAGPLMAVALLVKPMVLPALVPIGLLVALRGWRGLRDGLAFSLSALAVVAVVVLLVGPLEIFDQMVRFRLASRQVEGWSLRENWIAMFGELIDEQIALFALAGAAALLLLLARPRIGLSLVAWAVTSFGLLMVYSPLQFKHAVIMLPPVALLVGIGVGEWWRRIGDGGPRLVTLIGAALLLWYAASLPAIFSLDRRVLLATPENRPESYDEEISLVRALTDPRDFVLVDEPSVAFAARRLVPPSLVDTSMVRIRSRSIDAGSAIAAAERYDVRLLFLFSDGLRSLSGFADWVDDRFVPVKINERSNRKDRALYLRDDEDLSTARVTLERTLERRHDATFGGQLQLLGYALERGDVRPGGNLVLTLGWQATGPIVADYHVLTILRDPTGAIVEQNERALGGGAEGTGSWRPGRWVFRTSMLPIRRSTKVGVYQVSVALYDSKAKRSLPPDGGAAGDASDIPLTTIEVRG